MSKIVILGCGYIGLNLANYIVNTGFDHVTVYGSDNYYSEMLDNKIEFMSKRIEQINCADKEIFENSIVIDCTGSTNATNSVSDSSALMLENCSTKVQLIKKINSLNIAKYVFLSSGGTIYVDSQEKHKENEMTYPNNIYALEKIFIENFLRMYGIENDKFNYQVLRVANPYGGVVSPRKKQGIIDVAINKLNNDEELQMYGDLNNVRDYIYIDDFSNMVNQLIHLNDHNETYNVGSGIGYSLKYVITLLENKFGKEIPFAYKKLNVMDIKCNILDMSKTLSKIQIENLIDLNEGIDKCINSKKSRVL